jgi:hypothetical protein
MRQRGADAEAERPAELGLDHDDVAGAGEERVGHGRAQGAGAGGVDVALRQAPQQRIGAALAAIAAAILGRRVDARRLPHPICAEQAAIEAAVAEALTPRLC